MAKTLYFVLLFHFYKFLILKYTNTFAFSSLNRNFAVTLHKNNKLSLIYLDGTKEF